MYHIHDDKRVAQSITQICAAHDELVDHTLYRDVSVTALVSKAQISKATFYRSFDCLDDVMRLQTDKAVAEMIGYVIKYKSDSGMRSHNEVIFFEAFFRFWMSHSPTVERLIKTNRESFLFSAFEASLANHIEFFRKYAKADDETTRYFVAVRAASLAACLICWVKDGKRTHPDQMPQMLIRVMRQPEGERRRIEMSS